MKSTRNFWVETAVDGRSTPVQGGPAAADGGFRQVIYLRGENGTVETAVRVTGEARADGTLTLYVTPGDPGYLTDGSPFEAWPESMTIEPYALDGGGFGFKITSRR